MSISITIKPTGKYFSLDDDGYVYAHQWKGVTDKGETILLYVSLTTADKETINRLRGLRTLEESQSLVFDVYDNPGIGHAPRYLGGESGTDLMPTFPSEE